MKGYIIDTVSDCSEYTAAIRKLEFGLAEAKNAGYEYIKVVHGDNDSGAVGRIRREVRKFLRAYRKAGKARLLIFGEKFSFDSRESLYLFDKCPEARFDTDAGRLNPSICIVLL